MQSKKVAVIGANGFVGSALVKKLNLSNFFEVVPVTRESFLESKKDSYNYVINAAMPSARFKAKKNPLWDFQATIDLTAKIYYGWNYEKFVQISSISARSQPETIYGKHKKLAELICRDNSLIVRLGPMYDNKLDKGVLIDMLNRDDVYVSGESRYCFSSLEFCCNWIIENLDQIGIKEVGARNSIELHKLADQLKLNVNFNGSIDHQEVFSPEAGFPDVMDVINFLKDRL